MITSGLAQALCPCRHSQAGGIAQAVDGGLRSCTGQASHRSRLTTAALAPKFRY